MPQGIIMSELQVYVIIYLSFLALAVITFLILVFIDAPYGRHATAGWGPFVNNRIAWLVQEAPASLMMLFYFFYDSRPATAATLVLLIMWQIHYAHRAFIYPFSLSINNRAPLMTVLLALLFNFVNTYIQGRWLFSLAPDSFYTAAWLLDPRFIIGALVFITGYIINKYSDYRLSALRKPGESGYIIPRGGLYELISCPNYFGEMITWAGWSIATWSPAGVFFLVWTIANLGPRALAHHRWYTDTFPDYPKNRRALIPFIL